MKSICSHPFHWLIHQWPYAIVCASAFLVVLLPLWLAVLGLPLTLVMAQLPIYMVHQYEEHSRDRFRLFFNQHIGDGRELLTPIATFWINFGVWILDLIALYLAFYVHLSLSLIAIYFSLLNGTTHIAYSIKLKKYHPGFLTSLFLFLPVGGWSLFVIHEASHPSIIDHAIGLAAAILGHVFVILYVIIRMKKLN